jgi:hypothetical protein
MDIKKELEICPDYELIKIITDIYDMVENIFGKKKEKMIGVWKELYERGLFDMQKEILQNIESIIQEKK